MGYIPDFEYDIFISYAHVDNLTVEGGEATGWISQFHDYLELALAQRIGRNGLVKIWRDKKLEGDHLFDRTIQEGLEKSALFLAMTSNGYLASEYCQQELRMFVEKARAEAYGLSIGDRSRVFAVLINNIPFTRWPEAFSGISGHPLYDAEEAEDLGVPSEPGKKSFKKQIQKLVDSLYHNLEAFKHESELASPEVASSTSPDLPEEDDSKSIFLADVTDSLRTTRRRLKAELERKGVNVITGIPPPYQADSHAEKVRAAIQKAALGVHLLDNFSGREVDGEPRITYPQKQVDLVREASHPQLIWVPKTLDPGSVEEDSHREFIDQLENGPRQGARYDFVRSTSATLVPQILEKLEQLRVAETVASAETQAVLLDTHIKDQLQALELSKFFLQNRIQPYINPQEDDPNKNLEILEARMKQVSTLMILFGSVSAEWVRQRLGAALQLSVIRSLAIKAFCVVAMPPAKGPQDLDFHIGPIPITTIDNSRGDLNPNLLAPVMEVFRGGTA